MKLLLFFWGEKYSIRGIDVGFSFYILNINVFAKNVLFIYVFIVFWGRLSSSGMCVDKLCGQVFWDILFYMLISVRNLIIHHSFLRRIKRTFIDTLVMDF